ncbi:MAG: hypothetical protein Q9M25_02735 [Mariprofundaceae bacterium]|nr:hypothetical protein [Mariprofundaceae bacterium]
MKMIFKIMLGVFVIVQVSACTSSPVAPLGQEKRVAGEDVTIKKISAILTTHLKEQYAGEKMFLRDTHPKANACIRGNFAIYPNIEAGLQHGIFQPGSSYHVWMRFSNAVEEITNDYEKDFRGLALKVTGVDGPRVASPGDEQHTQDFLFLGHDAFFAANPKDFFDFFDAQFNGSIAWFFLTHPKGAFNIFNGQARYTNPLNLHWNSVTAYALGQKENETFKNVVRYAIRTCSTNGGEAPDEDKPDYLTTNLQNQLHHGEACLDFFIQKQVDAKKMPVENALVAWDQELSPFIKVARITIPKQTFTSEKQKMFCENMSFNPGHALIAHQPLGGINRARKVVMKDISDLRLKENGVTRFEPNGNEVFE